MNEIKFYKVKGEEYGFLSNFSPHGFRDIEDRWYRTSEHYFQAMKFDGTKYFDIVRLADTPWKTARLGRSREFPLRKDWEDIKDNIMFSALMYKFTQNKEICKKLLDTGDAILIEDSPIDYYWGIGKDGSGKNMLGKQLMKTRLILRRKEDGKNKTED